MLYIWHMNFFDIVNKKLFEMLVCRVFNIMYGLIFW